jgi:menaquinone-dependent protoporphyrinogen oxidase
MRVLVSAASRHGATAEIADRIGIQLRAELTDRGVAVEVDTRPAEKVSEVDSYDAVVLGSAVYMGRWLEPARQVAQTHATALAARPVWLFSCGPIGDPPKPEQEPTDAAPIAQATGAHEHRVFAGKLDRRQLGFAEKVMARAVHASEGDFRDWAAIDAWAAGIADSLSHKV